MTAPNKRAYSEESRAKMRDAALARFGRDADLAHERVRSVLLTIQEEISNNGGIYPNNKGAVSMAEVARRAHIHPFTFHKPRYLELGKEVRAWLNTLKQGSVVGRMRVRKELGTRVLEWKQLYEDLLEAHRISETDLAHAQARLDEVSKENAEMRRILANHASLKVVPLHKRPNDDSSKR